MPICPRGHRSTTGDYCDECGTPLGGPEPAAGPPEPILPEVVPPGTPCPDCGTPRGGRFCEVCGRDFLAVTVRPGGEPAGGHDAASGQPVAAGGWRLVATADPAHHARMAAGAATGAAAVPLPPYVPEREFPLENRPLLIGRHSRARGIRPDIDLSGAPQDVGVSHAHAMLVPLPDGPWAIVDLGSANGTYLNDSPDPIAGHVPVPLDDGDRVHLGAFTTLTLYRTGAA